jgi:hypothetical protein
MMGKEPTVMLERIVSGGKTGADPAAWPVARAFGIPTGGWMPREFLTEKGPRPEFAELYGAREMPSPEYRERTRANAAIMSGTSSRLAVSSRSSVQNVASIPSS